MINDMSRIYHQRPPTHPTYTSRADIGPSFGSYNPPFVGRPKLSSRRGLSIFLTDIDFTSSEVRKEKDRPAAWELMEWAISMAALVYGQCVALEFRFCCPRLYRYGYVD